MLEIFCLILLLCLQQDPFDQFEKLAKDKDFEKRCQAIEIIKNYKNLRACRCLVPLLVDKHPRVVYRTKKELIKFKDPEAIKWLYEKALFNKCPKIQEGVAYVLGKIKDKQATESLKKLLKNKNPDVLAQIILSLGELGSKDSVEKFCKIFKIKKRQWQVRVSILKTIAKLAPQKLPELIKQAQKDKNYQVRLICANLLHYLDKKQALTYLEKFLKDKDWKVRVSAIESTLNLWDKQCIQLLVDLMQKQEGRLRLDIAIALRKLTGQRKGVDPKAWKIWWDNNKENFKMPQKPQPQKGTNEIITGHTTTEFYKLPIYSKRVVYVIDLSGSMRDMDKAQNIPKLDVAKNELTSSIKSLPKDAFFNIVYITSSRDHRYPCPGQTKSWKPRMVRATSDCKRQAISSVKGLRAFGWTNIYDALEYAMQQDADTIILLSDGGASKGTFVKITELLENILEKNKFKKFMIHTIETQPSKKSHKWLLEQLAKKTKGFYMPQKSK